jgi:hypothetical protein
VLGVSPRMAAYKPMDPDSHEYDEGDWMENNWLWNQASTLVHADSMDVGNDPRFFHKSVMDKRVAAFKVLTVVSTLMFIPALKQCFSLKKDMNFAKSHDYVGVIGIWQIISFFSCMAIAIMCLLSLYIMAHQLFYTYRLMTAGPSGFDQSAIFYLTRTITMWRHIAIKMLFFGLLLFLWTVGLQLFVRFYKDAYKEMDKPKEVMVINMFNGSVQLDPVISVPKENKLCMPLQIALGYTSLGICVLVALLMIIIRREHTGVFEQNYRFCSEKTRKVSSALRAMSTRSGDFIET